MRTSLTVILTILGLFIFGQNSIIDEIKYRPDDFKFDHYPIKYPVVLLHDSTKSEIINRQIKEKTLDYWLSETDPYFTNEFEEIKFLYAKDMTVSSRLSGFSYSIVFDSPIILTIETDTEISDRKIWHIKNVFNLDLELDKILEVDDIVLPDKMIELNEILKNHKTQWYRLVKEEFEKQILNEKEEEYIKKYKYGLTEIQNCLKYYNGIKSFTIKKDEIIFDDGFEFSDGVLNMCIFPDYIPLNQRELFKGVIKPKYYDMIYEKQ